MKKLGLFLAFAALCLFSVAAANTCTKDISSVFTGIDFVDMKNKCVEETRKQINMEITASLKYLAMASYFSRDDVNRPGFAKLFFEAASEEREHAQKLIEYLNMRGRNDASGFVNVIDIKKLMQEADKIPAEITRQIPEKTDGLKALEKALKLEVEVTKSIRGLVKTCEGNEDDPFNHYHFVDYLTGEFLEEQYKGQRDLAGKVATLAKMVKNNGVALADFLFDKSLL